MKILLSVLLAKRAAASLEAREGLCALDRYTSCVKDATPIQLQDFAVDLHER